MTDLFDMGRPDGPDLPRPKKLGQKKLTLMEKIKQLFAKKKPADTPVLENPSMGGFMPPPPPPNAKMQPINKKDKQSFWRKFFPSKKPKLDGLDALRAKTNFGNDAKFEQNKTANLGKDILSKQGDKEGEKSKKPPKNKLYNSLGNKEKIQTHDFSSVLMAWMIILALSPVAYLAGTIIEGYLAPKPAPISMEFIFNKAEIDAAFEAKNNAVVEDPDMDKRDYFIPLSENHASPEVGIKMLKPEEFEKIYQEINVKDFTATDKKIWQSKGRATNIDLTKPKIIIIITPLGLNPDIDTKFLTLDFPITLGFLPYITEDLKGQIRKSLFEFHHEYLLAMPMQTKNSKVESGPMQLNLEDNNENLGKKIIWARSQLPEAFGVINMMGSGFMANREKSKTALEYFRDMGFYVIESAETLTNNYKGLNKELKIDMLPSDVFIDNELDGRKIRNQLDVAVSIANDKGYAVVIARPTQETYQVLSYWLKFAKTKGIELITPSNFLKSLGN